MWLVDLNNICECGKWSSEKEEFFKPITIKKIVMFMIIINISYNIVTYSGITDSPYYLQCDWWNSNLHVLVLLVIVIGPSGVQFRE